MSGTWPVRFPPNSCFCGHNLYSHVGQVVTPTPAAPSVTPEGTTGATEYQYSVAVVYASGMTATSLVTEITDGNAVLSSSNYNLVSTTSETGALAYVFFRQVGGTGGYKLLVSSASNSIHDSGAFTPETIANPGVCIECLRANPLDVHVFSPQGWIYDTPNTLVRE